MIASGGALLHSPAWTQIMADTLGRPVIASTEHEASCRGAALYALERIGAIPESGRAAGFHRRDVFTAPAIRRRLRAPAGGAARAVRETFRNHTES